MHRPAGAAGPLCPLVAAHHPRALAATAAVTPRRNASPGGGDWAGRACSRRRATRGRHRLLGTPSRRLARGTDEGHGRAGTGLTPPVDGSKEAQGAFFALDAQKVTVVWGAFGVQSASTAGRCLGHKLACSRLLTAHEAAAATAAPVTRLPLLHPQVKRRSFSRCGRYVRAA